MPAESSLADCTEVTVGTEAVSSSGGCGAETPGDNATLAVPLDGNTWEKRAQGAAQLSQKGQRVHLSSTPE